MARKPSPALDTRSKTWSLAAALACAIPMLRLVPVGLAAGLFVLSGMIVAFGWRRRLPAVLRLLLTGTFIVMVMYSYGFGIGRDTASAILLAMLMIKPIELNTLRDARSMVGFGLFALFAALLLDQGPLTLALSVPGAGLAFGACARMADAEVGLVSGRMDWKRVLVILGLFAMATPVALAGFWLFPRLGSPLWGLPNVARAKVGIADNMAPGDWLDLLVDDTPAFRVHFFTRSPPQESLYWRGLVMWNFDGRAWTPPRSRWPHKMSPATMHVSGPPVFYQVNLEPTNKDYLFALDLPQSAPPGSTMAEDRSLSFDLPVDSLRAYRVTSGQSAGFETELPAQIRTQALRLPAGYNPRTLALAQQWRSETRDDAQIVARALAMYHASFSYSLAAPPLGRDSVDDFLFNTKIGFCEHFSSSFTVLMRAAGIPARVVTGYVGGYQNRIGDFLLVRQSDAHAWSEVWLQGRGWTRVDPTAAVAPERVFRHAAGDTGGDNGGPSAIGQLFDVGDWLRNGWNQFVLGFDAARQLSLFNAVGLRNADSRTLAMAFATVTVLLLVGLGAFQLRDRGPRRDPLLRAWERFTRRLARAHLGKRTHEPALAWSRRIAPLLPDQGPQVLLLSERFALARYAPDTDEAGRHVLIRELLAFRVKPASRS